MKSSILGDEVVYCKANDPLAHSTRLKDLISGYARLEVDPKGVSSFLSFRYPIGKLTMFKDYKKIPCGHELKGDCIEKYWYPGFPEIRIDFEEAVNQVEALLIQSLIPLVEGKKIAIPLSGGLDSSLLVAMVRKVFGNKPIYTYSAGFYGDDEFEYSRLVAKEFRTVHKEKVLYKEDYVGENSLLQPLITHKCEPLHPNEIALAVIERLAQRDGCEIAICGEGADDIFGGYGQNFRMYMNHCSEQPFFDFFLDNYRYFTLDERRQIVKDEYLVDDFGLLMSVIEENELPADLCNLALYFTQKIHTVGLITRGANAMRFNCLETGFPYIEKRLVDFVNSLPFDYKIRWKSEDDEVIAKNKHFRDISERHDIPKYILKKLAEKYLPNKVIYRPKYGFPVPFEKWFKDLNEWPMDKQIFKTDNLSPFNGWKKFMLINLDTFVKVFAKHKK